MADQGYTGKVYGEDLGIENMRAGIERVRSSRTEKRILLEIENDDNERNT